MKVIAKVESRNLEKSKEEWTYAGTALRRLLRTEESENRASERDLDQYLQKSEETISETPHQASAQEPFRLIESRPVVFDGDHWNDDASTAPYRLALEAAPVSRT